MIRLPNFFLAGAPKAGTTALYQYLGQHPNIYMSPVKEPNFFAKEIRLENFSGHFRKLAEAPRAGPRAGRRMGRLRQTFRSCRG